MLNIIKSELYKMIHRKCTYVFLVVFVVGGFFINLALHFAVAADGVAGFGDDVVGFWSQVVVSFSWFMVYMIAQIIHSNESKIGVLKNSISFGISRLQMYIARFFTQLISLILGAVIVVAGVLLGNLVFNGGCSTSVLTEFLQTIAATGILWIGALSVAHALAMCLNSNSMGTVLYILYFIIGTSVIDMGHYVLPDNKIFTFLSKYEMYEFAGNCVMEGTVMKNLHLYFIIGGVYFIVSFGLGLFFFCRKEVK